MLYICLYLPNNFAPRALKALLSEVDAKRSTFAHHQTVSFSIVGN